MYQKTYNLVVGFLFLGIGLLHIVRVLYQWQVQIGGMWIPFWVSGVAALVAFVLSFQGFRLGR